MIQVIPAANRHRWKSAWLDSRQSFPATGNFDLAANAHGVLLVHNDDRVDAGEGFDAHHHRDAEIITWVLEGSLRHQDSAGHTGIIRPGIIQRMTSGRGITHTEANASPRNENHPLRVVQMWVAPEYADLEPGYAERDFSTELQAGSLIAVASGMTKHIATTAITLANPYAALHVARLPAEASTILPAAEFGHLYVARGSVGLGLSGDVTLREGDTGRTTDSGELVVTATDGAEILFWEMHAAFAR